MLRERYPGDKLFDEIVAHFPAMDPVLVKIDNYLEDEQLYQLILQRKVQKARVA